MVGGTGRQLGSYDDPCSEMRLLLDQIRTGGSPRKGKREYCALDRRAFDPNAASVRLDDPPGNRQDGYELAFYFTHEDGAVVGRHDGSMSTAVTAWYPSWAWRAGETVRIETPVLAVGRGRGVLVAVVTPSGDPARDRRPRALPSWDTPWVRRRSFRTGRY